MFDFRIPRDYQDLTRAAWRGAKPAHDTTGTFYDFSSVTKRYDTVATFSDSNGKLTVEMDVPGVKKEDVTVEVHDKILRVTTKRNETVKTHRIDLTKEYYSETSEATLKDGVLTVVLSEKAATRHTIPVK